ncbi:Exocyst complex component 5 [Coemansia sp. RSA 552]|nr:Exocyst complex component 5 [Coemansia sp. RSA 552]
MTDPSREFGLGAGYFGQRAFLADEFVEELSRADVDFARKHAQFEPRPFVRTFERALAKLETAQSALGADMAGLERAAGSCADDHRRKMARLKQTFATVGSSFERLEAQISEVGGNTVRIGEQLDTVAKEKERAEAIRELVGFYAELNEGSARRLDEQLEGGADGMAAVAHTLRRLNTIVADNEYSAPADARAKRQIEVYSENFEKTVLGTFEAAYRDGDVPRMAVAARTLDAFNGGVSVVKAYINQHPFFLSSMVSAAQDSIAEASYQSMEGVSDIARAPPPPDRWLAQLYTDTRAVMFKDWAIISRVFPRPIDLMQQLLRRVFEQTIQSYLETLFARADGQSKLAFLRVLASSHQETRRLVEDLQKFDAETITPAVMVLESTRRAGSGPHTASSPAGLLDVPAAAQFSRSRARPDAPRAIDDSDSDDDDAARYRLGEARSGVRDAAAIAALIGRNEDQAAVGLLHAFLDRCCDDLFEAYTAGGSYMTTEQAHLKDAFRQILVPFVRARSNRQGTRRGKALLGMLSGSSAASAPATEAGDSEDPDAAALGAGTTRTLLQVHAEAVARAVELESDTSAPDAVAALTSVLITTLGDDYVFPALEDVLEALQDPRHEPALQALDAVREANVIVRLLQVHFQRAIVPFVGNGSYIYRDIVAEKNQLMSRVELSLNLIVNKFSSACTQWIATLLGKQRKGDFRPAEDDFTAFEVGTEPCRHCTDFLVRVERTCRQCLGADNCARVLADIGSALHRMLMEHLRKFVVSVAGGLVLAKDVSRYREAIAAFDIPALGDKFSVLQDISNIFLVQSSALKSMLDEGPLARLDRSTLQAFVSMREDNASSGSSKSNLVRQFM